MIPLIRIGLLSALGDQHQTVEHGFGFACQYTLEILMAFAVLGLMGHPGMVIDVLTIGQQIQAIKSRLAAFTSSAWISRRGFECTSARRVRSR